MLSSAFAADIAGHKDRLFASPPVLSQSDSGAFKVIDYREMRDINGRDQVPERRVKRQYVDLSVRRQTKNLTLEASGRTVEIGRVGRWSTARFAVVFIHGRGGDRRLGINDYSFGGNFNRLKNLVVRNGGSYIVPSVRAFSPAGLADVKALIGEFRAGSGGAPVIVACASMGSMICQGVAEDPELAPRLAGMALLGGMPDARLAATPLAAARVPITFAHGSNDSVYPWQAQKAVFDRIRNQSSNYPARFVLFNSGSHGTPIRMIDWKAVLTQMLKN
ncbi:lysophospholipase [Pseudohoeflea sp. DP4N28-3]|uniref:Lysophospholipase n=1 Tax=Pseudohoeflea coraliihabitans TaxID=2860393 RepID=A0ABS6WQI7_9HYPH|nr:lysophospholipase [Pseudohoeflea sp. DP4N28-3]